ncbi:MAG: hypothetical protein SFY56_04570 [Bacteroidota bacterium]|nr:hypothetical protein [Bacteroidota bacterium]
MDKAEIIRELENIAFEKRWLILKELIEQTIHLIKDEPHMDANYKQLKKDVENIGVKKPTPENEKEFEILRKKTLNILNP